MTHNAEKDAPIPVCSCCDSRLTPEGNCPTGDECCTRAPSAEKDAPEHPHVGAVRAYLDNAGITPETLRYAATHEALCRSWIFDLLTNLADVMEADARVTSPGEGRDQ